MKETELAAKVVAHYSEGYEVYKEVAAGGGVIDIVLSTGALRIAIECKTSFSLDVIEQAHRNREHCHYSYVAVPANGNGGFARQVCQGYGIGVLRVDKYGNGVREEVSPKMNRKPWRKVRLQEFQKENEAGCQSGRITVFGNTVRQLVAVVRKSPGIKMADAIKEIDHHYSKDTTAKAALYGWIRNGVIGEVRHERGKLFLKEAA